MSRSTRSYEERILELERKEQENIEKSKQYNAQVRALKKKQAEEERKKRTHRLCQIGGTVESVLGRPIEEDEIPMLIAFLQKQETNGRFFSKAMQRDLISEPESLEDGNAPVSESLSGFTG